MSESDENLGVRDGQAGVAPEPRFVSVRQTAQAFSPHIGAPTSDTPSEFDEPTSPDRQPKVSGDDEPTWRVVFDIVWRVLLVAVGIPAVWILRHYEVVHLTAWQATGISVVLFLFAIGEYALAALW
ncbi:Uncharacterised protein [Mycobacteroides abscessus subsp. bolletii]|uniref:Transmembrane protein n=1 Tax=Mycobacteroides abscessus subsp. bolletii TaxID=319705 RepID=A0A9Q7SAS2_9MYCO|nr:PrgI family protein [Mycobacteroides abscessus]SHT83358.1 Uncharacterised protein [Mycobacteroides abscessus subsp. bolletii]SHU12250.1 Uncharacterised protein [Mycobacteroides abscessus subsp. bolletii]SHW87468.1 Uncharacterised protein [Mycobacteroides abscessus subsp. bolletii]SIC70154.1 Uncharacterised protein [Mycobacteroides abscessus subsp. abscessus]SKL92769.1 Uncharacterised protein [Mycobacteroides abscessus subsp. bolletii]